MTPCQCVPAPDVTHSSERQKNQDKDNQDKANQEGLWLCSSGYFDLEAKREHTVINDRDDCNERTHLILHLLRNTCLIKCMASI